MYFSFGILTSISCTRNLRSTWKAGFNQPETGGHVSIDQFEGLSTLQGKAEGATTRIESVANRAGQEAPPASAIRVTLRIG